MQVRQVGRLGEDVSHGIDAAEVVSHDPLDDRRVAPGYGVGPGALEHHDFELVVIQGDRVTARGRAPIAARAGRGISLPLGDRLAHHDGQSGDDQKERGRHELEFGQ